MFYAKQEYTENIRLVYTAYMLLLNRIQFLSYNFVWNKKFEKNGK